MSGATAADQGVIDGCKVTEDGPPSMNVIVGSGRTIWVDPTAPVAGTGVTVPGPTTILLTDPDPGLPRLTLIEVDASATVQQTDGAPAIHPLLPPRTATSSSVASVTVAPALVAPTVLDDFARADENPLSHSGDWANPLMPGDSDLQLVSDKGDATATTCSGYWTTTFGPDSDIRITALDYAVYTLFLRVVNPNNAAITGYQAVFDLAAQTITINRVDDSTTIVQLFGRPVFMPAGCTIAFRIVGDTLTALIDPLTGVMEPFVTITDATYATAGNAGVQAVGPATFSDFAAATYMPTVITNDDIEDLRNMLPIHVTGFDTDQVFGGDMANSQFRFWLDDTPGATILNISANDSAGTLRVAQIPLA